MIIMSYKRKGQLAYSLERKKHLRRYGRHVYWRLERLAEKKEIRQEVRDLIFGMLMTSACRLMVSNCLNGKDAKPFYGLLEA